MKRTFLCFGLSVSVLAFAFMNDQAATVAPKSVNFDRDVLPILSSHCYKCHGPDATKAAAGLRLDSFSAVAISKGSPEKSLLIHRVSDKDAASRMPPEDSGVKPLKSNEIAIISQWIRQGAPYEKHWSYVPPVMPKTPRVENKTWPKNPLDQFILSKLEAAGMKPEPEADKNTLALRAAEVLTGLPPSQAELEQFRADNKAGAYERYVDRLIAKPSYGEHQARYWLDAVRYSDTHGLQLDNERSVYPYRDWVVRAFNTDLPYDKFVEWQIAGDLLPKPTTEQLVATGYVRMNLTTNEGGAIADEFLARNTFDRVDTTSTVMLGLTVQCAKCHDHKYDPIKQKDYYGLYAFFNSTKDDPLDGNIALPAPFVRATTPAQEATIAALTASQNQLKQAVDLPKAVQFFSQIHMPVPKTKGWTLSTVYSEKDFDAAFDKPEPAEPGQTGPVTWTPFAFESGKDFTDVIRKDNSSIYAKGIVTMPQAIDFTFGVSSDDAVKVWLNGKLIHSHKIGRGVSQGIDRVTGTFKAGDNELLVKVINGIAGDGFNIRLFNPDAKMIDGAVRAYEAVPNEPGAKMNLGQMFLEFGPWSPAKEEYEKLHQEQTDLENSIPMTLVAEEMEKPRQTFILKRGDYTQKGDEVHRHIPGSLGALPPGAPLNRLGFAEWLIEPSNPLVNRVFVNRVWQQYFGTGIVKTTEDFGSQGEWPQNQPLLDYLAVSFAQNGESIKKLNRMIVTSATFRQGSNITQEKLAKDPENRLISRGPRFRLDAEVIRDKALFSGGLLVDQQGGRGFKPYQPAGIWESASDPASATHIYEQDHGMAIYRRSMYLFWKRTAPPPSMLLLDAPLRDTCVVRRSTTNTPLQALTVENEPAFLEASRTMAQRLLSGKGDDLVRLKMAYELTMARAPKQAEVTLLSKALAYYRSKYSADSSSAKKLISVGESPQGKNLSATDQAAWMIICSTLMNTDEFLTIH
jgi:hypothetical protein